MLSLIKSLKNRAELVIDIICLALICYYLAQFFPSEFVLADTTITGGDTASHYQTVAHLKDYLWKQWKVIGWFPGNYGGFPLFIYYFPLLYLLAIFIAKFLPLTISFKIITAVGIFLLPICTYLMLRLARFVFPAPIFAAMGSVVFLLNTSNSMWGGNIYSNFAGEFSYQTSFALVFLLFGLLSRISTELEIDSRGFAKRYVVLAIVVLALIGLTHGFTLLISVVSLVYFLLAQNNFLKKAFCYFLVFCIGGCLFAWWFIPLFANLPYATQFNLVWAFYSWKNVFWELFIPSQWITEFIKQHPLFPDLKIPLEIIPDSLVPFFDLYLIFSIYTVFKFFKNKMVLPADLKFVPFTWFVIACSTVAYFESSTLQLPDIRFIPFIQFLITVFGAAFIGKLTTNKILKVSSPFFACFVFAYWLSFNPTDAQSWAKWNYQGFENAPDWKIFSEINQELKGSFNDPLVVFENNEAINSMGSSRAFESLPFFANRSTAEGLYFQSSLLSPFVFYAQSLYSRDISCPFQEYACTTLNYQRAYDYLKLMNVNQLILQTEAAKTAARKYPDFYQLEKTITSSPYEIWKLKGDFNYVEVIDKKLEYIEPDNFRVEFYRWFRNYPSENKFLYTLPKKFALLHGLDKIKFPINLQDVRKKQDCKVSSQLEMETMTIHTSCPNIPHLVKIAYNPGWKATNADGPYLISPAYMLIVPRENDVRLDFDVSGPKKLGQCLALLGVIGLLLIFFKSSDSSLWGYLANKKINNFAHLIFILLVLTVSVKIYLASLKPTFHEDFVKNEIFYTDKNYQTAQLGFAQMLEKWKDQPNIDKIYYYLGISYYLDNKNQEAIETFKKFYELTDSQYRAEGIYHIGICASRQGNVQLAKETYQYVIDLNHPIWSAYAKERLKELD